MARRNIFEIAKGNYNFDNEFYRIYNWFTDEIVYADGNYYQRYDIPDSFYDRRGLTIEGFVNVYTILDWKARKGFTTTYELLKLIELDEIIRYSDSMTYEQKLLWFEYALNITETFFYNADYLKKLNERYFDRDVIKVAKRDINACLESVGYESKLFKDEQQVIIVQKNAYATSVAELVDDDLAEQVFEYNRFNMKGDLEKKSRILVRLEKELEGKEAEMPKEYKPLLRDIGNMLNNFDLRHHKDSNTQPVAKKFNKLTEEEQEQWYDKTYDLLLLAFLSIDGDKIHKELEEFTKYERPE